MPTFDLGEVLAKVAALLMLGIGLATFSEVLVEYLIKPIIQLIPAFTDHLGSIFLKYVVLAVGFIIAWLAGYDFFTPLIAEFGLAPHPLLGPVMSALAVGGGAPLIHAWIEKWRGGESVRTTGIRPPTT